jgi:hypothetical protein
MDHMSHGKLQPQPIIRKGTMGSTKNNLRSTVMTRTHQIGVILIVEGGTTEVNQPYLCIFEDFLRFLSALIALDFKRCITDE